MSFHREISPIIGANLFPPNTARKTSSGSTYPPLGVLSFGPNSLYFLRSLGSERTWYAIAIFLDCLYNEDLAVKSDKYMGIDARSPVHRHRRDY